MSRPAAFTPAGSKAGWIDERHGAAREGRGELAREVMHPKIGPVRTKLFGYDGELDRLQERTAAKRRDDRGEIDHELVHRRDKDRTLAAAPEADILLGRFAQGYEFNGFAHLLDRKRLFVLQLFGEPDRFPREVVQVEADHRVAAKHQVREIIHRSFAAFRPRRMMHRDADVRTEKCRRPNGKQDCVETDPVLEFERLGHKRILGAELRQRERADLEVDGTVPAPDAAGCAVRGGVLTDFWARPHLREINARNLPS